MNNKIAFISILFWAVSTHYFGWNMTPQSDAELICDGITMLILAMAFLKEPTANEREVKDE